MTVIAFIFGPWCVRLTSELWEEPEVFPFTNEIPAEKLKAGRDLEMQRLLDFDVLEWVPIEDAKARNAAKEATYISSRWEDQDRGDVARCRWVLRDFANTKSLDFFAATPTTLEANLLHAIA